MRKHFVTALLPVSLLLVGFSANPSFADEDSCVDECGEGEDCIEVDCDDVAPPTYVAVSTCVPVLTSACGPSYGGTTGYTSAASFGGSTGGTTGGYAGTCTATVGQSCTTTMMLAAGGPAKRRRRVKRTTPMPEDTGTNHNSTPQTGPEILADAQQELMDNPVPDKTFTSTDWLLHGYLVPQDVKALYDEQIKKLAELMHTLQDRYEAVQEDIANLNVMTPEQQTQMLNNIFVTLVTGQPPAEPDMTPDEEIAASAQNTGPTREQQEEAMREQMRQIAEQLADAMMRYYDMRASYVDWLNQQMQNILHPPSATP